MAVPSNEKHALHGKRVVIIGRLKSLPRRNAVARLEVLGGTNQPKVNTFTDLVVLPSGESSGQSQLLTDAKVLEQAGRLKIIDEDAFLEMISGN